MTTYEFLKFVVLCFIAYVVMFFLNEISLSFMNMNKTINEISITTKETNNILMNAEVKQLPN